MTKTLFTRRESETKSCVSYPVVKESSRFDGHFFSLRCRAFFCVGIGRSFRLSWGFLSIANIRMLFNLNRTMLRQLSDNLFFGSGNSHAEMLRILNLLKILNVIKMHDFLISALDHLGKCESWHFA